MSPRSKTTDLAGATRVRLAVLVILLSLPTSLIARQPGDAEVNSPLSAEESLSCFRLPDGLRIELVASEPQVIDPVAIRFDHRGRLWVVQMQDYPRGPEPGHKPTSQIRILEDHDGDGRFETSTPFAQGLLFPTGLQPWRDGVIVTLAGRVVYLADQDGDGRADREETWYSGFAQENSQLRANHPCLALDNQVYVANGLRGGKIVGHRGDDRPQVPLQTRDFRFNPRTGTYEAVSGNGQFGLTFDDFGNRFVCSNRNPLQQVMLEDRYAARSRTATVSRVMHDVAAAGSESRVFPLTRAWTTSNLHAGQFTAACGALIFRGDGLGDDYYGNAFVCEPTGNLVHRELLRTDGVTYRSEPARAGIEFLASTDPWFRPVDLVTGPDGALYVVDMYRAVIEHPEWVPAELKQRPDTRHGDDRGRIYRIISRSSGQLAAPVDLGRLDNQQLLELLSHANAWWRETAARLLLERLPSPDIVDPLSTLARSSSQAVARVRALWLSSAAEGLQPQQLLTAVQDQDAMVRRQALVLMERHFAEDQALRKAIVQCCVDDDPRVRLQAVLSLVPVRDEQEVAALARTARVLPADGWTRSAICLAADQRAHELVQTLLPAVSNDDVDVAALAQLVEELAANVAAEGDQRRSDTLLNSIGLALTDQPVSHLAHRALRGWLQSSRNLPASWLEHLQPDARQGIERLVRQAELDVADQQLVETKRVDALQLLSRVDGYQSLVQRLALSAPEFELRVASIDALARQNDSDRQLAAWRQLLLQLPDHTPVVRRRILEGVLGNSARADLLLDLIDAGDVRASELDQLHLQRLLKMGDAAHRARPRRLLDDATALDRRQVLARYQAALRLPADSSRGRTVFAKHCATCHRIGDVGVDVGPDISDSRTQTSEQLLQSILLPNQAIDAALVSYTVVTRQGQILTGILANETSASITLKQPEGKSLTLRRDAIEQLRSNGVSLMPEGLERDVSLQDMADLIAFIKNWRYLDGSIPVPTVGDDVDGQR